MLGIKAGCHDPAAALVVDGRIVAAAGEERFRRRNFAEFPPNLADSHAVVEGMDTVAAAAPEPVARRLAFADFYRDTWPDLAGFCHSLVRNGELADEIAQEAFTRLYVRYPVLREPRAYVFRIATNLVRDAWRRPVHDPLPDVLRDGPAAATDHDLLDAVRRLSRPLRDVVLLHYYADLPVDEVAAVLRRPVGTVKRRLHDARLRLALDLEEVR